MLERTDPGAYLALLTPCACVCERVCVWVCFLSSVCVWVAVWKDVSTYLRDFDVFNDVIVVVGSLEPLLRRLPAQAAAAAILHVDRF